MAFQNRRTAGKALAARLGPLEGPDTIMTVNPQIYGKLNFRTDNFVPVIILNPVIQMLTCHPSVGVKSVSELIALAKSSNMNYASGGAGANYSRGFRQPACEMARLSGCGSCVRKPCPARPNFETSSRLQSTCVQNPRPRPASYPSLISPP